MQLDSLYTQHLSHLDAALTDSLARAERAGLGCQSIVFHAGSEVYYHADDQPIPFRSAAHFRRWVPPLDGPDHLVLARPGERPVVVRVQPSDYWYDTAAPPASHWQDAVDERGVGSFDDAVAALGPLDDTVYIGPSPTAAVALGLDAERINPAEVLAPLDWHRATKSDYEIAVTRKACQRAAAGHLAAQQAFLDGANERQIYWAFLAATGHIEQEIPYGPIVALDDKSAVLHYEKKRHGSGGRYTLLLDAGAAEHGYAADLTRTWARADGHPVFRGLIERVDALERRLVADIQPGASWVEIHLAAHRQVLEALHELGVLRIDVEQAIDAGLGITFMPHGVGHHLGLQVHDVGGHQATPEGGVEPPPEKHPFLRSTRPVEAGHLLTVEPGCYFIPALLDPLRDGELATALDWSLIDALIPYGGVRIEDNVWCTEDGYEDLSRELIEG